MPSGAEWFIILVFAMPVVICVIVLLAVRASSRSRVSRNDARGVPTTSLAHGGAAIGARASSNAGWQPDPFGRFHHRYWDGSAWTSQVATGGRTFTDEPTP